MLRVPPITTETVTLQKERPRPAAPGGGLGEPPRVVVLNDNHNGHKELAEHYWRELPSRGLTMAPPER